MEVDTNGPNHEAIEACKALSTKSSVLPKDSLIADDLFTTTCENIRNRNESRVIRAIAGLIVPSAEILSLRREIDSKTPIEGFNEGWNATHPITPVHPQPDFSVGYRRAAFTEHQLDKIRPILGDSITQVSLFRATVSCPSKACYYNGKV